MPCVLALHHIRIVNTGRDFESERLIGLTRFFACVHGRHRTCRTMSACIYTADCSTSFIGKVLRSGLTFEALRIDEVIMGGFARNSQKKDSSTPEVTLSLSLTAALMCATSAKLPSPMRDGITVQCSSAIKLRHSCG